MSENPFAAPQSEIDASEPEGGGADLQRVMHPLFKSKGWLSFIGIMVVLLGALYCVMGLVALIKSAVSGVFLILFGVIPIWLGALLRRAGQAVGKGYPTMDVESLAKCTENLHRVFKIVGIYLLVCLGLMILAILLPVLGMRF